MSREVGTRIDSAARTEPRLPEDHDPAAVIVVTDLDPFGRQHDIFA